VTEVLGYDQANGAYALQDLFVREYRGFDERGLIISSLVPSGVLPRCLPQLHEHGVDLPPSVYGATKRGESRRPNG
jgi:pilus assembly protein CpaF